MVNFTAKFQGEHSERWCEIGGVRKNSNFHRISEMVSSKEWQTNRKSHMRFRLVPKSLTLDDLELPIRIVLQKSCVFWSSLQKFEWRQTHSISGKNVGQWLLVTANIRCMRIFAGVPLAGCVKQHCSCPRWQFEAIYVATSSETLDGNKASNIILWYATLCWPVIDCKMNGLQWP